MQPRFIHTTSPDRLAYARDCWPHSIILTRGRQLEQRQGWTLEHFPSSLLVVTDAGDVVQTKHKRGVWANRSGDTKFV